MYITKTAAWRIALFSVAALGCAVAFAVINHCKLKDYQSLSNQTNKRSFAQLCEAVSSIDSELSRSTYALNSSGQLIRISNQVSKHSEAAKTALAALPSNEEGLDKTAEFLTLAADYCSALAIKSAAGIELSDSDIEGLTALRQSSSALSNELNSLYTLSNQENFFVTPSSEELSEAESSAISYTLGISFTEENMPDSPVLIYDGPYSSHITHMKAVFLESADKEISVVEGIAIAADFMGTDKTSVKYLCKTEGDVVVYTYADTNESSFISLTVQGGNILTFSQNAEVANTTLTGEDAAKLGAEFLASKGYEDLTPSYWYCTNGICYINYHHSESNATVYPDLIQLGIRLDTGEATYLNAYGYLWNHTESRNIAPVSDKEAVLSAFGDETAEYSGLCIIPSDGKNEILCHEIKCTDENETHYLIYINDSTGEVEKIFVLVEDENGTLTV